MISSELVTELLKSMSSVVQVRDTPTVLKEFSTTLDNKVYLTSQYGAFPVFILKSSKQAVVSVSIDNNNFVVKKSWLDTVNKLHSCASEYNSLI